MSEIQTRNIVLASRKRLLLAVYIDYLFFGAFWTICIHLISPYIFIEIPVPAKYISFVILELSLFTWIRFSPGFAFLSIYSLPWRDVMMDGTVVTRPGKAFVVPGRIKLTESWMTMTLAFLALSGGIKEMVRWTMWNPQMPVLGPYAGYVPDILIGAAMAVCSYGIYKLTKWGYWSYMGLYIAIVIFTAATWPHWDAYTADLVVRRRAYQGIPVREGEIEAMQSMVPEIFIMFGVLMIILIITQRKRFSRRGENAEPPI